MKKSYLFILLCLLFCGQVFAQRPTSTTPENPKDAPITTGTCEGANYNIKINTVHWSTNPISFFYDILPPNSEINIESLPGLLFNVVELELAHPKEFEKYTFNIDNFTQTGSSEPTIIVFFHMDDIKVTAVYYPNGSLKGFEVQKNPDGASAGSNLTSGGVTGVATAAAVEHRQRKYMEISTKGEIMEFDDGTICSLTHITSSDSFSE